MTEAATEEDKTTSAAAAWTTWEELLLACAVKRHGFDDWDTVAVEIRTRTELPLLLTAQICEEKYRELSRRFGCEPAGLEINGDGGDIPWIEELRKLRIAELQQELQKSDLTIQFLESKVKRLREEREQSVKNGKIEVDEKPDLEEKESKEEKEFGNDGGKVPPPTTTTTTTSVAGKSISGRGDTERSFNESNSTEYRKKSGEKPDRKAKKTTAVVGDSCNDSSDTKLLRELVATGSNKDTDELRDSVATESKEGTAKESSEVQSSASLMNKKKKKRPTGEVDGGGDVRDEPAAASPATRIKRDVVVVKSEPLVKILDMIRKHKHGSLFERRLQSQKTEKYKNTVRQHVDLRLIQARINDGFYSSCLNKFFLDLLLVFNNAIVFYSKSSIESKAAHELRDLVLKEMRKITKKNPTLDHSQESVATLKPPKPSLEKPDPLLTKNKSSIPIVVCKKRSSISNKSEKEEEKPVTMKRPPIKSPDVKRVEKESSIKMGMKEKPVTGVRSMRRSSNGRTNSTVVANEDEITKVGNSSSKSPANSNASPQLEKKKSASTTVNKRGVVDFLKRIKKNSPEKANKSSEEKMTTRKDEQKKKGNYKQAKEDSLSKRGVGRPKKGKDATDDVPLKRRRDGGEGEAASRRPTKRSRR